MMARTKNKAIVKETTLAAWFIMRKVMGEETTIIPFFANI
jgi:hypothetical protein